MSHSGSGGIFGQHDDSDATQPLSKDELTHINSSQSHKPYQVDQHGRIIAYETGR